MSFSEGDRILSHEFVTCTRETIAPDAVRGIADRELRLYFDYLNPGDGFALEVVHDSADSLPEVKGTVKGLGPKGIEDLGAFLVPGSSMGAAAPRLRFILGSIGLLSIVVGLALVIPGVAELVERSGSNPFVTGTVFIVMGIGYMLPAVYLSSKRVKFPKSLSRMAASSANPEEPLSILRERR